MAGNMALGSRVTNELAVSAPLRRTVVDLLHRRSMMLKRPWCLTLMDALKLLALGFGQFLILRAVSDRA